MGGWGGGMDPYRWDVPPPNPTYYIKRFRDIKRMKKVTDKKDIYPNTVPLQSSLNH